MLRCSVPLHMLQVAWADCGAGSLDASLESDLADLQLAMALGPNEARNIRDEVITVAYR